jgi:hypothetical protein
MTKLLRCLNASPHARTALDQLSLSCEQESRLIAAALLQFLWVYWKYIPYHKHDKDYQQYHADIAAYVATIVWTLPIVERLLNDQTVKVLSMALYILQDVTAIPQEQIKTLRDIAIMHANHPSAQIRLAIVRVLYECYPKTDNARHVLDEAALQFYVDSTYDPNEQVRDWACFELWLSVENLTDRTGRAFLDAVQRESPESEVYMEAVIGLARVGIDPENTDRCIIERLADPESCTKGWVDAAEQSHSDVCRARLIDLRNAVIVANRNDTLLDAIECALANWDE